MHDIAESFTMQLQHPDVKKVHWAKLSTVVVPKLVVLMYTYEDVFVPKGLAPKGSHDYHIPLMNGTRLVKVRPYRYPLS